jgi:hypothetical protein
VISVHWGVWAGVAAGMASSAIPMPSKQIRPIILAIREIPINNLLPEKCEFSRFRKVFWDKITNEVTEEWREVIKAQSLCLDHKRLPV